MQPGLPGETMSQKTNTLPSKDKSHFSRSSLGLTLHACKFSVFLFFFLSLFPPSLFLKAGCHCVTQAGLLLMILLAQLSKYWHYRVRPPHLSTFSVLSDFRVGWLEGSVGEALTMQARQLEYDPRTHVRVEKEK